MGVLSTQQSIQCLKLRNSDQIEKQNKNYIFNFTLLPIIFFAQIQRFVIYTEHFLLFFFGFMGKSLPHPTKLKTFVNFIGSDSFPRHRAAQAKPGYKPRPLLPSGEPKVKGQIRVIESSSSERRLGRYKMEESAVSTSSSEHRRVPLADVVTDCIRRWFQDTLKEAKAGDISMQVLVGQMYFSGYGVPVDAEKGRAWISRASRTRSSAWKVSDKRPGYNLSDSDSDDNAGDVK